MPNQSSLLTNMRHYFAVQDAVRAVLVERHPELLEQDRPPIQTQAIRDAWEDCKRHGLNDETMHFMDNALDGAGL